MVAPLTWATIVLPMAASGPQVGYPILCCPAGSRSIHGGGERRRGPRCCGSCRGRVRSRGGPSRDIRGARGRFQARVARIR
eukprot:2339183-Pyramimonas_sp.AAC.1